MLKPRLVLRHLKHNKDNSIMTFNKGGRPKLPVENKRTEKIQISLTKDEMSFIIKHANLAHQKQIATFLRLMMISFIESGKFTYQVQNEASFRYLQVFRNAFNNLNQSTKHINSARDNGILSRRDLYLHAEVLRRVTKKITELQEEARCLEEYSAVFYPEYHQGEMDDAQS